MTYLCRFKIRVKFMPFDNNRNSRDGKSNRGGKPAFNKNTERPHSKRYDSAPGSGRPPREDRPGKDSPYKKRDRPFSRDENFKKDDRPKKSFTYKKDDKPFKKDDRYKKANHYRKEETPNRGDRNSRRSEEHTSELQSRENLVCRLLL